MAPLASCFSKVIYFAIITAQPIIVFRLKKHLAKKVVLFEDFEQIIEKYSPRIQKMSHIDKNNIFQIIKIFISLRSRGSRAINRALITLRYRMHFGESIISTSTTFNIILT